MDLAFLFHCPHFFCLFFSVYFLSHLFRLYFLRNLIGYKLIFSLIIDFSDHKTRSKVRRFSQKYNLLFVLLCMLCMDKVCPLFLSRICFLDKKEQHIQQKQVKPQ